MIELKGPMVVLDIETTSAVAHETGIVQLHILKIFPDGRSYEKQWVINPEKPITPGAIEAHGITDAMVADKPTFKQVSVQIYNELFDCKHIVTYNGLKFDLPIVVRHLDKAGIQLITDNMDLIDVFGLVRRIHPRTLVAMYRHYFGSDFEGAHDAGADVMATIKLMYAMVQRHEEIPKDLKEMALYANDDKPIVDLSGFFTIQDNKIVFSTGKHQGEVVDLQSHRSYLTWMVEKGGFSKSTVELANKFLNNQISN